MVFPKKSTIQHPLLWNINGVVFSLLRKSWQNISVLLKSSIRQKRLMLELPSDIITCHSLTHPLPIIIFSSTIMVALCPEIVSTSNLRFSFCINERSTIISFDISVLLIISIKIQNWWIISCRKKVTVSRHTSNITRRKYPRATLNSGIKTNH